MGRISVVTDEQLVEAFRQHCFNLKPKRRSMNDVLVEQMRRLLGIPADAKSPPKRPR